MLSERDIIPVITIPNGRKQILYIKLIKNTGQYSSKFGVYLCSTLVILYRMAIFNGRLCVPLVFFWGYPYTWMAIFQKSSSGEMCCMDLWHLCYTAIVYTIDLWLFKVCMHRGGKNYFRCSQATIRRCSAFLHTTKPLNSLLPNKSRFRVHWSCDTSTVLQKFKYHWKHVPNKH